MARRSTPPLDDAGDPALSQKKRARRRLIGAIAVLLAAIIALPLLLDSEPRTPYPDVEVSIPSRDTAAPLALDPRKTAGSAASGEVSVDDSMVSGAVASARSAAAPERAGGTPTPSAAPGRTGSSSSADAARPSTADARDASADTRNAQAADSRNAAASKPAADDKAGSKPAAGSAATPAERTASAERAAGSERATAAESKPAAARAGEGKVALQLGAFASASSAKAMADRARQGGVSTYTETVRTSDGTRTRVRVGPFPGRDEAERMRGKLKLVGIDSRIVPVQP